MFEISSTQLKLADHIHAVDPELLSDNAVIASLCHELKQHQDAVSHKDILLCLIRKIEAEQDIDQQDAYLQALEYAVYNASDDEE
ncbi:biofilm development protein AriR [Rouxiella sp. S1S-2]|uniref:biofilm development regulator YmgB/AriR family protein n=1 Tax=Rouxiella sp. S1S-2 TaxID=2653856 RepID=UPI00126480F2|nr:biofilm development regulator YmgB/AriR family protein [Rouxiella sp. S1S-2]KAB7897242.1 biofilm development protein AriR [Rouxiella sp. S1S-2]